MSADQLPMWIFSIGTAMTAVAGLLATRIGRGWLGTIPIAHVVAATLIGASGWEALVYLPGTVQTFLSATAGIPDPQGIAHYQAFAAASAAVVIATVLAVVGILRRRPWGVVTGIGLAATRAAMSIGSSVSLFGFAESFPPQDFGSMVGTLVALNTVPPLLAIALLVWPLLSGRSSAPDASEGEGADWSVEAPSPEPGR